MIEIVTVGMIQEHTYFFIDSETKHGFVIDPGDEAERLLKKIKEEGWIIEKILLTHGHFDHIGAVEVLRKALSCPVLIHEEGKSYLYNADWNLSSRHGNAYTMEADTYLVDGDIVELEANADMNLRVIYAPGHTSDGTAFYSEKEKVVFVGDILFDGSVGRCDNPGGDMNRLLNSIRTQIFTLPEDTKVFPGHGNSTTIKKEIATNPFFNVWEQ